MGDGDRHLLLPDAPRGARTTPLSPSTSPPCAKRWRPASGLRNVALIASLKNGVNDGVAEAWAKINGSDVSTSASDTNGGFPYIVDDRHRSLCAVLDAAVHPRTPSSTTA